MKLNVPIREKMLKAMTPEEREAFLEKERREKEEAERKIREEEERQRLAREAEEKRYIHSSTFVIHCLPNTILLDFFFLFFFFFLYLL